MLPARGFTPVSLASWLRATLSNPEQKCSPALVSRIARTASSRPARSTASMAAYIIVSSERVALVGARQAQREHAVGELDVEAVDRLVRASLIGGALIGC